MKIAQPLPECALCEAPTRRSVHERNRGLCSTCAAGIADTVRMLPVGLPSADQDLTVNVEKWLPPVPGQQAIEDQP